MSSKFYASALTGAALVGLLFSGGAGAQTGHESNSAAPHEVIFVYAPYVVTRQVIDPMMSKKNSTGIELVSQSRTVNFGDLDLSDAADVATLTMRVRHAAQDACTDIERRYPYRTNKNESTITSAEVAALARNSTFGPDQKKH